MLVIALVIAELATLFDWSINPDGVFHGPHGTDWGVVVATWISWFWPTVLVLAPFAAVIAWLRSRR